MFLSWLVFVWLPVRKTIVFGTSQRIRDFIDVYLINFVSIAYQDKNISSLTTDWILAPYTDIHHHQYTQLEVFIYLFFIYLWCCSLVSFALLNSFFRKFFICSQDSWVAFSVRCMLSCVVLMRITFFYVVWI